MKRFALTLVGVAALAACGHLAPQSGAGATGRVPANPPSFTAQAAPAIDHERALRAEREALTRTITTLRKEVAELRQLFRLKNAPLDGEVRTSDALSAPPALTALPIRSVPPVAAAAPQPAPTPTPVAISTPAFAPRQPAAPQPAQLAMPAPAAMPVVMPINAVVPAQRPAAALSATAIARAPANYTTLFKMASASLDDSSRPALADLRPQLLAAGKVELNAFADPVGDRALNSKLAQARALAVQDELLKLGVDKSRISVNTAVVDSKPSEQAAILGLFRAPEAMSRRVDLALLQLPANR